MRTPPAKYLTDFDSGKSLFYLIKLVSDTTTRYWTTSDVAFSLWPNTASSHGGAALTKDSGQIAFNIDGREEFGIGTVETGVSIEEFGGGINEIGDFEFRIVNQDGISTTLNAENFTNRAIEFRMGFIDTVNGTGVNDMLLVGSFIVDSAEMFDWGRYTFRCVDPTINLDKELPKESVTKALYPRAPSESIGKTIPTLYGDFQTFNLQVIGPDSYLNRFLEKYDLAPTVVTSFSKSLFGKPSHTIASHEVNSINEVFYSSGDLIGAVSDAVPTYNASDGAGLDMLKTYDVVWYIVPEVEGTTTQTETITNQFDFGKDKDFDTFFSLVGTSDNSLLRKTLFFTFSRLGTGTIKTAAGFTMITYFGQITGLLSTVFQAVKSSGGTVELLASNSTNQNSARYAFSATVAATWSSLSNDYEYGYTIMNCTAQIRETTLKITSTVYDKYGTTSQVRPVSIIRTRANDKRGGGR